MKDEFSNRLMMFKAAGAVLLDPVRRTVWEGKEPLIFGAKATAAVAATDDLEEFCREQGVVILAGADKDREETELENLAFSLARSLVEFYTDRGDGASASKFDHPISWWQLLRDADLLGQAETVRVEIAALGARDAAVATAAAEYGLNAAAAVALKKEWDDYDALVAKPRQVAGDRRVLTSQLRERFNAVEAKFVSLENLIGQFGGTPAGRDFIAAFRTARIVIDRRGTSAKDAAPATPTA